ncbi:unnamed protein product [marine sediment metagenome]|uniref:Uncharacterized protein n=1 Tax=marine sediment metagenome TaxID=412755 RepID=X1IRE6_9ZZZZ
MKAEKIWMDGKLVDWDEAKRKTIAQNLKSNHVLLYIKCYVLFRCIIT